MFTHPRSRQFGFTFAVLLASCALLFITSLTLAITAKPANTIVVNPGESIQAAIDAANPGDTILINAGTYTESLTLSKAVSLTGVSRVTTRLHGVANQSVLTVTGGTISNSVVISGLTFANSGGSGVMFGFGGGLIVQSGAQPLIQHVTLDSNTASDGRIGGGIGSFSSLTLVDVEFLNNTARDGGGLYIYGDTILTDCVFINNSATNVSSASEGGGAIHVEGNLRIFNTDFISNSAYRGGGIHASGEVHLLGGRFIENHTTNSYAPGGGISASSVIVSGTKFLSNTSTASGGAIAGGQVIVINGYFEGNVASFDGGAISAGSALQMTNTEIINNLAGWDGCGVYIDAGTAQVIDSRFVGNLCWGSQENYGGGLYAGNALILSHTQFISNTAQRGAFSFTAQQKL